MSDSSRWTQGEDRQASRRSVVLGVGAAMTAGVAAAVTPRRHEQTLAGSHLADVLPMRVGPWNAQPADSIILPEAAVTDGFYDQVVTRAFNAPGTPGLMLLVAYGAAQSGMMKVHRPEVCYASAGFAIHDDQAAGVALGRTSTITAKTFLAKREDRTEQVLYWTRISNAFPVSLTEQRLVMIERGLTGVIPDGVLVRISTLGADLSQGQAVMQTFARGLVAAANPRGRALLVGALKPTTRA